MPPSAQPTLPSPSVHHGVSAVVTPSNPSVSACFPLSLFSVPRRPHSVSRRVVQRFRRFHLFVLLVNHVLSCLNTLHCSFWSGAHRDQQLLCPSVLSGHSSRNGVHPLPLYYLSVITPCRRIIGLFTDA